MKRTLTAIKIRELTPNGSFIDVLEVEADGNLTDPEEQKEIINTITKLLYENEKFFMVTDTASCIIGDLPHKTLRVVGVFADEYGCEISQ